ncbi:hypothetical protein APHAL10511_003030 [Amanita phalloides]|nr:hypothetical protein APHAL10511_003030 [Amanita phalloides]
MHFTLITTPNASRHAPRLGKVILKRPTHSEKGCLFPTPNFLTSTSRGVVPHLSRDHHNRTEAIRWVNVPFETFLDRNPPVPTLHQSEPQPLHAFLGFKPRQHVLSMTVRDSSDGRDMPPNGNDHVSVYCLRGVRKISPSDWRSHVSKCQPDVVVALSDVPFTEPPYSQRRLTKSIDRSAKWLADILRPIAPLVDTPESHLYRPTVLVHMAGGVSITARRAFSDNLRETLFGKEAQQVSPLRCLDDGVSGYTFDLVPLRLSLEATMKKAVDTEMAIESEFDPSSSRNLMSTSHLIPLMKASLESLPVTKLRLVNTCASPHEMLHLIRMIGVDLFDAHWAQNAANIGIALDFTFPAPPQDTCTNAAQKSAQPRVRTNGKRDLGHNLYEPAYASDFSSFASCFAPTTDSSSVQGKLICPCLACSPVTPKSKICHGSPELEAEPSTSMQITYRPPHTRAYLHHLLQTHEMSAHSLLVMHNLSVLDTFFAGVRNTIEMAGDVFEQEVDRFIQTYDEDMVLFAEGAVNWRDVDLARGKGRLAREKARVISSSVSTPSA